MYARNVANAFTTAAIAVGPCRRSQATAGTKIHQINDCPVRHARLRARNVAVYGVVVLCIAPSARAQIVTSFTENYSASYSGQIFGEFNGTYYNDGGYGFPPAFCGKGCTLGTLPATESLTGQVTYTLTGGNGNGPQYAVSDTKTLTGTFGTLSAGSLQNQTAGPFFGAPLALGPSPFGASGDLSAVGGLFGQAGGNAGMGFGTTNALTPLNGFSDQTSALTGTANLTSGGLSIQQNTDLKDSALLHPYTSLIANLTGGSVSYTATEGPPPPTVGQYAAMANQAWNSLGNNNQAGNVVGMPVPQAAPFQVLTTTQLTGIPTSPINATAFYTGDPSSGGQIVIAIGGGLQTQGDADTSFVFGPTPSFTAGVNNALQFLATLAQDYPTASISITGGSLGGGVAEILGALTGLQTVAFEAPGGLGLVSNFSAPSYFSTANVLSPGDVSAQLQNNIVDYVTYGDQIPFAGQQAGAVITVTPASVKSAIDTAGVTSTASNNISTLISLHDGKTLLDMLTQSAAPQIPGQLGSFSGTLPLTVTATGTQLHTQVQTDATQITYVKGTGPNYFLGFSATVASVLSSVALNTIGSTIQQKFVSTFNDIIQLFDPPPGYLYSFVVDPGSPEFTSIDLPFEPDIGGWVITWYTDGGASGSTTIFTNNYAFVSPVDRVDFYPIDLTDNPMLWNGIPTDLIFAATFDNTGDFSGTLTTDLTPLSPTSNPVPEPMSLSILGSALIAFGVITSGCRRLRYVG